MSQVQVTETQSVEIDRLRKAAEGRILSSPTKFVVMGLAVFGALAAPVGAPVAAVCAMPLIYSAIKRAVANGDNAAYLRETGLFAHLLHDRELVKLTQIVGKDAVLSHLKEALDDGKNLSGGAIDYLEYAGVDIEPPSLKTFLQGDGAQKQIQAEGAAIDVATVPAVATAEDSTAKKQPAAELEIIDLAAALGRNLKPLIISAMPRTGKGILISHARNYAKAAQPDLEVWVIDPKAHPSESGYWQWVDRLWAKPLDQFAVNDESIAAEIEQFISEWRQSPARPKLLIFDELVLTEARLPKWFKEFVPSLMKTESSSGETDKRYLWAITQSPLVSDMGLSGGNRSAFMFVTLGRPHTTAHLESARKSGFIPNVPTQEEFDRSPVKTLAFYSGWQRWIAIPEYLVPQAIVTADPRANLEAIYQNEPATELDASDPLEKLTRYLASKGQLDFRTLEKNWGRNNNFQGEELRGLVTSLVDRGSVAVWGDGIIWKG